MAVSAPEKRTAGRGAESGTGRRPWFVVRALPFVAWQVVAIIFAELVLAWAGLGEEEIFKLDPVLGTRHLTDKSITWRSEGYARSYLNADGLREPGLTVAKPAGTYRIALLGDSMVEGFQVPIEDTFGQMLERRLKGETGRNIQVINFGTSGYSTAQEYLQLKSQVLRYSPDLVVLCYNSRDMFENWSPADEVITNVRPVAVHLPGNKLVVHSFYVQRYMNTVRARFLNATEWIRQHSRIWGLVAAMDLDLSMHNPAYKALMNIINAPKNTGRELAKLAETLKTQNGPAFKIKFFEDKAKQGAAGPTPAADPKAGTTIAAHKTEHAFNSAAPNAVLEVSAVTQEAKGQVDGHQKYVALVERTMGSLIGEMRSECASHGADFMVAAIPVRAALCPVFGQETSFWGIDYAGELTIIKGLCRSAGIPMVDVQEPASVLPTASQASMFYNVHLRKTGHQFIADRLYDAVLNETKKKGQP